MIERLNIVNTETASIFFKDGTLVLARKIENPKFTPGPPAKHEAAHVVAAGEIVEADIISKDGALGTTRPLKMTPATAAAAEAMGYRGTGWDKFLTENYLNVPWSVATSSARAVLSGQEDLLNEVAETLEEKKIIHPYHVREAKRKVEEKRQGIFSVKVDVFKSGVRVKSINTKSLHGEIIISHIQ